MFRHLTGLVVLAATWALLSGHFNVLLITLGGLSCLLGYLLFIKITEQVEWSILKFNPWRQGIYLCWLLGQIIKANFEVIAAIIKPGKASPQLFEVTTSDLDELGKVVYANSITLTPGTVTTAIADDRLQVHALLTGSKDSLVQGEMLEKVRKVMQKHRTQHDAIDSGH